MDDPILYIIAGCNGAGKTTIIIDYEGTSTCNFIYKAGQVYDLDFITIISQRDYNERAIILPGLYHIKAIDYNAAPFHICRNRIKNTLREYFARVNMFGTVIFATIPAYQGYEAGYSKIPQ